mmetsp:Transcript_2186/g.14544  ORF Transcript_2186/g.14544 Transcript_2186/m.14544 type:complete len:86 (+) Transcript_2186:1994-2251(+)
MHRYNEYQLGIETDEATLKLFAITIDKLKVVCITQDHPSNLIGSHASTVFHQAFMLVPHCYARKLPHSLGAEVPTSVGAFLTNSS